MPGCGMWEPSPNPNLPGKPVRSPFEFELFAELDRNPTLYTFILHSF